MKLIKINNELFIYLNLISIRQFTWYGIMCNAYTL